MVKDRDYELEWLLSLDGYKYFRDDGFWWQIEVRTVTISKERPHGLNYSLTLHDKHNRRVFGIDNAHGYGFRKNRFSGQRIVYDHKHHRDKVFPYDFQSSQQLLTDFFAGCDEYIAADGSMTRAGR